MHSFFSNGKLFFLHFNVSFHRLLAMFCPKSSSVWVCLFYIRQHLLPSPRTGTLLYELYIGPDCSYWETSWEISRLDFCLRGYTSRGRQLHLIEAALLFISKDTFWCLGIIDTCLHLQTCHINQHYPYLLNIQ